MRKLLVLGLAALFLVLSVFPAAAAPPDELTALARYFPVNTPVFAAQRIDDAYVAQVNDLLTEIDTQLDGTVLQGMTIYSALDMMAQEIDPEGDFESVFGGWVGDTAAIGVLDMKAMMEHDSTMDNPVQVVFAIVDSSAAEAFLDDNKPMNYVREQVDEGVLFHPPEANQGNPTMLVTEDALLIRPTSIDPMAILPRFDKSLADHPEFGDALGRLPRDEYDGVVYVNLAGMRSAAEMLQMELEREDFPMDIDLPALFEAAGAQALGGVIVDGNNFVLDISTHIKDLAAFEALGMVIVPKDPVDLAFADHVPAGAIAFLQSTNIGGQLLQNYAEMQRFGMDAMSNGAEGAEAINAATTFMRLSFEGLSGLTLDEAFGWMSGDSAIFLRIVEGNDTLPILPDFASMVTVTDDAAASAFYNGISEMIFQLGLDLEEEEDVLVMPILGEIVGSPQMDMLMANNGELLVSGTRSGVEDVLAGGDSVTASAAYQAASALYLSDAQSIGYVDGAALNALAQTGAELTGDRDLRQVAAITPLLESLSLSATSDETGGGTARLVMTLNVGE